MRKEVGILRQAHIGKSIGMKVVLKVVLQVPHCLIITKELLEYYQEVLVHAGQSVKRGDVIGLMGSSGRSTGPHVHFEVLKSGKPVNPAKYVSAR